MHWILQEGFLSDTAWTALLATLRRFEISYSVHAVMPKTGALVPPAEVGHQNVICIGSYSMRHVALANGWTPGVFDLYEQDFEQQRQHWGDHMLNAGSIVCALQDAIFSDERMFVRPVDDSKQFSGRVFTADEFALWQRSICEQGVDHGSSLTPAARIQLSRPVLIFAEYRFWVVNGEIITQSLYRRGNQVIYASEVDARLAEFVRDRISEWSPHHAFVIDACDSESGMKIVEINTLNSSAFYAADVQRLVMKLQMEYRSADLNARN